MSKIFKIILIVILSLLFIATGIFLYFFIKNDFKFNVRMFGINVSKTVFLDEEYDDNYKEIVIDSMSADIEIKKTDSEKVRVVLYSEEKDPTVVSEDGKLKITTSKKECKGFCFNRKIDKVEIYLPSEYENSISIDTKFGDILMDEFKNADIKIESDCGDVEIDTVNKADIKVKYGDVEIDNISELIVDSDCGDIKVDTVNNYIDVVTNKGDIKIDTLNIDRDSKIKTDMGDIKISKVEGVYIDAETDLGDVKVKDNDRKSDITLSIKTNLGDIKVNN